MARTETIEDVREMVYKRRAKKLTASFEVYESGEIGPLKSYVCTACAVPKPTSGPNFAQLSVEQAHLSSG
jgi:hypothetical protein